MAADQTESGSVLLSKTFIGNLISRMNSTSKNPSIEDDLSGVCAKPELATFLVHINLAVCRYWKSLYINCMSLKFMCLMAYSVSILLKQPFCCKALCLRMARRSICYGTMCSNTKRKLYHM